MKLPVPYPYEPMEAESVASLPVGKEWLYEPKWDGFRCLAFRDGDTVRIQSKAGKPIERYFPDVVETVRRLRPKRFVLDGEIVIPVDGHLAFDELLLRIHPAASRVRTLVKAHPARLVAFDLLVEQGKAIVDRPLAERRRRLDAFAKAYFPRGGGIVLSKPTRRLATAQSWLATGGGGDLDGVIAKRVDLEYRSGERDGMVKIKRQRTADCVVGGFRYASKGERIIGSLLLGLYDDQGLLHHVGFCSSLRAEERKKITPKLERLVKPPGFTGKAPGGQSRWSTERSTEWEPLAPKLVVEVTYDHVSGGRFRHGTKFVRWRPDKAAAQCTMNQLLQRS